MSFYPPGSAGARRLERALMLEQIRRDRLEFIAWRMAERNRGLLDREARDRRSPVPTPAAEGVDAH